jgi:hypothetical protein
MLLFRVSDFPTGGCVASSILQNFFIESIFRAVVHSSPYRFVNIHTAEILLSMFGKNFHSSVPSMRENTACH